MFIVINNNNNNNTPRPHFAGQFPRARKSISRKIIDNSGTRSPKGSPAATF
jgi:hypothetical protein